MTRKSLERSTGAFGNRLEDVGVSGEDIASG
jgi:hypothetical protein